MEENSETVQVRWILVSRALVQLSYKETSTFSLFASFTLCQLCTKLTNLFYAVLLLFDSLMMVTCGSKQECSV